MLNYCLWQVIIDSIQTLNKNPHTRFWCKNGSWGRLTWQLASFIFSESDLALVPAAAVLIKELAEYILLYKYLFTFNMINFHFYL